MINEEKAKNIALENVVEYHTIDDNGIEYLTHCYNECKKSALDMAEWKDKQEIEFLQSLLFQSTTYHIFDRINDRIKLLKGE